MAILITKRCSLPLNAAASIRCCLSVLVVLCLASPAAARLTGDAELAYIGYSVEQDGKKVLDLTGFSQKYSLYYSKSGFVGDQRLGRYNLGLGYEWTSFSTKSDSASLLEGQENQEYQNDSGKVLFRGDVTIAPGALPFRFHAFSFDNQGAAYDTIRTGGIINKSINFSLHNREEVISGMTLMAGIRNGTYLGAYRQTLSALPRVFIDYRQQYLRDMDSLLYKRHSLTRDLAFVSLNKKDNWFHYRAKDYTDYMDGANDTSSRTIILGTIDHTLKRQWINMTNWIRISADGSFTKEESEEYLTTEIDPETYRLNAFAKTDYHKTRFVNYNNFRRTLSSDKLEQNYEIPLYGNGWLDANRSWSMQVNKYAEEEEWFNRTITHNLNEEGEYFAGRLSVGHQQKVKYDTTLELESDRQNLTDAVAVRARIEMSENRSVSGRTRPWLLGYASLYIKSNADERVDALKDLFEQELYGSSQWILSPRNTFELRQNFRYSSGISNNTATRFILAKGYARTFDDQRLAESSTEGMFASETFLALESRFSPRFKNRVQLSTLVYSGGDADRLKNSLEDRLSYTSNNWRIEMTNGLYQGDDLQGVGGASSDKLNLEGSQVESDSRNLNYVLGHQSSLFYSPNRNLSGDALFSFNLYDTDDGNVYKSSFQARGAYNIFSLTGTRRLLGKVYQEINYDKYSSDFTTASYFRWLLGVNYIPRTIYELGAELAYQANQPQGTDSFAFSTIAALRFSKLICEVRYSYGYGRYEKGTGDNRKEHLYEAKIKKLF